MDGDRKWLFEHPIELGNALNNQRVHMGSKKPLWRVIDEMTPLERKVVLPTHVSARKGIEVVTHTDYYIKARQSFVHSKEWRFFRSAFLELHPACVRCKSVKDLQVHHAGLFTVDVTLINEGFLLPLTHLERFEALCGDCHFGEHEELIVGEKIIKSLSDTNGLLRKHPEMLVLLEKK